jgi:chitinase
MTGGWSPSAADTAAGRAPGFGVTIDIINGGLECHMPGDARVADRIGFYMRYTTLLGVTPGANVDCGTMSPF